MDLKSTTGFPGIDHLFLITDPLSNAPFRGKLLAEAPVRLLRGELSTSRPVRVEHAMGGQLKDVIWTTWAGVFLVEQRVCDLLRRSGISGWTTYEVEVTDQRGLPVSGYSGFAVTGRCGPIDHPRAELFLKASPVPHGKATWFRKGLFLEPDSWDGSDLFCPDDTSTFVVATERTRRLLEKSKVRNLSFKALSAYEVMALPASLLNGLS
jgi:hypothetical protein